MWAKEISEGAHVGATTHQGTPWGCWRALVSCGHLGHPPHVLFALEILKYSKKIMLNFQGILRIFIFGSFFYCTEKTENRINMAFYFI